jgi:16S rRNA (uracil1498-N3)-methyltransferase
MSSIPRIFVSAPDVKWPVCHLDATSLHHLKDVLRLRAGQMIEVVAGDTLWTVILTEFQPKSHLMVAEPHSSIPATGRSFGIHLLQGLPKGDKFSEIIRCCTEMGARSIAPVITERCVSTPGNEKSASKRLRWQQIAYSAAAQSRQSKVPMIDPVTAFKDSLAAWKSKSIPKLLFWEEAAGPVLRDWICPTGVTEVCILIGPEGGISPREAQLAIDAGFEMISLGPTILRVEHAALVAMAQLDYALL